MTGCAPRRCGVAAALAAAVVLLLTGCVSPAAAPTATAAGPTPTEAAEACAPAPTDASWPADVVTAAELCALDGGAWQPSAFTFVTNAPDWGETSAACDEARVNAYWDNRELVQPAITTLDLRTALGDDSRLIGSVGIAVIPSDAPQNAVALLDAERAACLTEASGQSAVDRAPWHGVRGPFDGDAGDLLTWWAAGPTSWAYVQAFASETLSPADAATLAAALETALDAQAARLAD